MPGVIICNGKMIILYIIFIYSISLLFIFLKNFLRKNVLLFYTNDQALRNLSFYNAYFDINFIKIEYNTYFLNL